MIELMSTKLFIPRPRPKQVHRPHLVDRLNNGLEKKLTLIAAPAGFGKTTLLSEWIPQSPRCVTWLSLDVSDNDPTRFWTYFIRSLQALRTDLGEGAFSLLQTPQAPPITSILTTLINDITAFPDMFSIVLDDYHVIDSAPIQEALVFLIEHQPPNMNLVLTTRIDPLLPIARLRARHQLTELRANDLRFTANEAASFLNQTMDLNLSSEEVAALEERTEGWIVGLQIASLSMQGRQDVSGFIRAFSGNHRHILGYLAEEVLIQQQTDRLDFLLQTSILDRMCGPLCDAVTGRLGGQAVLEALEHANLFIAPLDEEGVWYRYHHLFAEVLQARLVQTGRDLVRDLHRRAGQWFASQGMMEKAVRHTLEGADFEEAARLIETVAGNLLRKGSSASITRWFKAMPEDLVRARPRLCLARGWSFFLGAELNIESADEWSRLALQAGTADRLLSGEVAALRSMVAVTRGELARCRTLSQEALNALPLDSPWRTAVTFGLGTAYLDSGDIALAARSLTEAIRLSQATGDSYIQFTAASFRADIKVLKGQLRRAVEMYQQVLTWADSSTSQKGEVMAHGGLANIYCERNQLGAALTQIQLGADQLDRVGGAWSAFTIYRALARVRQAQGEWIGALDALTQAYQLGERGQVWMVMTMTAALRAALQLARGDLAAATIWAENSGLSPGDENIEHPGWREVEYLTLARVLAARGQPEIALSLLDRLLRSAQADGRNGSAIGILILSALVEQKQGTREQPFDHMERALTMAEPEGYTRIFLDEGEPMRLLLHDCQTMMKKRISRGVHSELLRLLAYTDKLLAAFPQPAPTDGAREDSLTESLSTRELEILQLIATGRTNQEIAEILVIAVSTVKSHINNLYGKLGTNRRTEAVAIAQGLGILSN